MHRLSLPVNKTTHPYCLPLFCGEEDCTKCCNELGIDAPFAKHVSTSMLKISFTTFGVSGISIDVIVFSRIILS